MCIYFNAKHFSDVLFSYLDLYIEFKIHNGLLKVTYHIHHILELILEHTSKGLTNVYFIKVLLGGELTSNTFY